MTRLPRVFLLSDVHLVLWETRTTNLSYPKFREVRGLGKVTQNVAVESELWFGTTVRAGTGSLDERSKSSLHRCGWPPLNGSQRIDHLPCRVRQDCKSRHHGVHHFSRGDSIRIPSRTYSPGASPSPLLSVSPLVSLIGWGRARLLDCSSEDARAQRILQKSRQKQSFRPRTRIWLRAVQTTSRPMKIGSQPPNSSNGPVPPPTRYTKTPGTLANEKISAS